MIDVFKGFNPFITVADMSWFPENMSQFPKNLPLCLENVAWFPENVSRICTQ